MRYENKRRAPRVKVDFPVTVQIDGGHIAVWIARAVNISSEGILVRSIRSLPVNVPFIVHFSFKQERTFAVALVTRCTGDCYGCEFINLPPNVYEVLDCAMLDHYSHSPRIVDTLKEEMGPEVNSDPGYYS